MSILRDADAWVILTIRQWPDELGTISRRYSTKPLSDTADYRAFGRGQIPASGGFGTIERAISSTEGQYEQSDFTVTIEDMDGELRGFLADPTTNRIDEGRWEVTYEQASSPGRAAQVTPVTLFSGIVTDAVPDVGRLVRLTVKCLFGAALRGFDLDQPLALWKLVDDFGHLEGFPDALKDQVAPLVYGENSDHGTTDANGANAEKGLIPLYFVGKTFIGDAEPAGGDLKVDTPTNLAASVVGTPGARTLTYGWTWVTPFGETRAATVTIDNAPDVLDGTNYVHLTVDGPEVTFEQNVTGARVFGRDTVGLIAFLTRLPGAPGSITTSYDDQGQDVPKPGQPPTINTARVSTGPLGTGGMFWDTYVVAAGVLNLDTVDIYSAIDFNTGEGLHRGLCETGVWGVDFLRYGCIEWPHLDRWRETNGRRYTVIYGRGPRSDAHVNGVVALTLNGPGYREHAIGTGKVITQAGRVLHHLLTNWGGLSTTQPTYTNEDEWLEVPEFAANGIPKLRSSTFLQFDADAAVRMSNLLGYELRFVINTAMTIRDLLTAFVWSTTAKENVNHLGQLEIGLVPHGLRATGPRFRDRIEIKHWLTPTLERTTPSQLSFVYDYDSEAQAWRRAVATVQDDDLIAANGGVPKTREQIELRLVGSPAVARNVIGYWLEFLKRARRFQPFETTYRGLASDLRDPIQVTHYDGLGATGETGTQMVVARHRVDRERDTVVLTGLDVSALEAPQIAGVNVWPDFDDDVEAPDLEDGRLWSEAA